MTRQNDRHCLIIAPGGADLTVLIEVLHENGYEVLAPTAMGAGVTWLAALGEALGRADLVVGVLDVSDPSAAFFDLGFAVGRGTPILIIAPPSVALPVGLSSVPVVRATITNREALEFALPNFRPPGPKRRTSRLAGPDVASLIPSYRARARTARGRDLEELVATVFTDAGIEAKSNARIGPREIDLAIWSDALEPYLGAPVLVEVKDQIDERGLARALAHLTVTVNAAQAQWGILVYREGPAGAVVNAHLSQAAHVLALTVDDLLDGLARSSLFDLLRSLRNRKIHGVGQ
ncbi:hypothetical protein [Sorangium sp. So ce381]|uniref:hypothetical protein n=1 Tax=Sorangium sp. So ce381 TaxID=3133307 RepID=UPI003F5C8B63